MSYQYPRQYRSPQNHYNNPYEHNQIEISSSLLLVYLVAGALLCYNVIKGPLSLPPIWALLVYPCKFLLNDEQQDRLHSLFGHSFEQLRRSSERVIGGIGSFPHSEALNMVSDDGWIGGLYNTGNTCYQNSVLQALASLTDIPHHLQAISAYSEEYWTRTKGSPSRTLHGVVKTLNTRARMPHAISVPSLLKLKTSTSSWYHEQQDAQEFFQSLTHALELEASESWKGQTSERQQGLETLLGECSGSLLIQSRQEVPQKEVLSPFHGLLAQRVGCLGCGYVEAIRMQDFTSMSLALPSNWTCSIEQCLEEYTSLETLTSVPCEKCTLVATADLLKSMIVNRASSTTGASPTSKQTIEVIERLQARLETVEDALNGSDFSKEVLERCRISQKSLVHSNKTKQIMIARPPPILVLHLNRSMFDMASGGIRKNHASLRFNAYLDLERWVAGDLSGFDIDPGKPIRFDVPSDQFSIQRHIYRLRSIVTHYGTHGNGHYVCYRQTLPQPLSQDEVQEGDSIKRKPIWWRCSDTDIRTCTLDEVLSAGNAFMLFYEKVPISEIDEINTTMIESRSLTIKTKQDDLDNEDEAYESDDRDVSPLSSASPTSQYMTSASSNDDYKPTDLTVNMDGGLTMEDI